MEKGDVAYSRLDDGTLFMIAYDEIRAGGGLVLVGVRIDPSGSVRAYFGVTFAAVEEALGGKIILWRFVKKTKCKEWLIHKMSTEPFTYFWAHRSA